VKSNENLDSDYNRFMVKGKAKFQRMSQEGCFDPEKVFQNISFADNLKVKDVYFLQADVFHGRPPIPPRYADDIYHVPRPFVP